jgi:hypothetical protein
LGGGVRGARRARSPGSIQATGRRGGVRLVRQRHSFSRGRIPRRLVEAPGACGVQLGPWGLNALLGPAGLYMRRERACCTSMPCHRCHLAPPAPRLRTSGAPGQRIASRIGRCRCWRCRCHRSRLGGLAGRDYRPVAAR